MAALVLALNANVVDMWGFFVDVQLVDNKRIVQSIIPDSEVYVIFELDADVIFGLRPATEHFLLGNVLWVETVWTHDWFKGIVSEYPIVNLTFGVGLERYQVLQVAYYYLLYLRLSELMIKYIDRYHKLLFVLYFR